MGLDPYAIPDSFKRLMSPDDKKALGKVGLTVKESMEAAKAKDERDLQNLLVNYLSINGVLFVHRARMDRKTTGPKGTPDLMFAYRGIPCAWEVKMPGEKLRPEQSERIRDMRVDGWMIQVVENVQQAQTFLRGVMEATNDQ